MTTPTVIETRRNGNHVGERMELGRYRTAAGVERVLYGQRVANVVRFLPQEPVVLDSASGASENSGCCPREPFHEEQLEPRTTHTSKNENGGSAEAAHTATRRRGRTGPRVELARYSIPAGDRVLYGQRVDGVVRLTDVPLEAGGRAYLIERGLEEEGSNANAALIALIADYLHQASVLAAVPMAEGHGRR